MSQHAYSTQPDRFRSPAFSAEPRRTPLSRSVSAFDVTISSLVGVAASLCSHSLALITAEVFTCRHNPVSLPELRFAPSAYVSRLPVVAGSLPRCQHATFWSRALLLFDVVAHDHLMSVINLSSPTAVAGRILPANSSQTQCLQGFNPLVDHWSFEPLCGLLSSGE